MQVVVVTYFSTFECSRRFRRQTMGLVQIRVDPEGMDRIVYPSPATHHCIWSTLRRWCLFVYMGLHGRAIVANDGRYVVSRVVTYTNHRTRVSGTGFIDPGTQGGVGMTSHDLVSSSSPRQRIVH